MIAQDTEEVVPEAVKTDSEGWKSIQYAKLTPVLIEAVKEQQQVIEQQNERLGQLDALAIDLTERLRTLRRLRSPQ
jgi:hypothetical protein